MSRGLFGGAPMGAALRLLRDRRGGVAMMIGLCLPLLIGITALGVETGVWYTLRTQNQSAADAAALAGAYALLLGTVGNDDLSRIALYDAQINGAVSETTVGLGCTPSGDQLCINNPPLGRTDTTQVEAYLSQQQPARLAFWYISGVTLATRAVASVEPAAYACLFALSSNSADAMTIGGSITVEMKNCGMASWIPDPDAAKCQSGAGGCSITFSGGGSVLAAGAIEAAGAIKLTGTQGQLLVPPPAILTSLPAASLPSDPYQNVTIGTVPSGACTQTDQPITTTMSLSPGTLYCGPLWFGNGAKVTMPAGVYYVTGGGRTHWGNSNVGLEIDPGAKVSGAGVTIALTAVAPANKPGSIQIDPQAQSGVLGSLSAPTAALLPGSSAGLLIFQDPTKTAPGEANTINLGGPAGCSSASPPTGLKLTGAIYTPNAVDQLNGGTKNVDSCGSCTELLASTFRFTGSGNVLIDQACVGAVMLNKVVLTE